MTPKAVPICPRCGYDLTGIVATWTDSCPVQGVCSECGLTFDWCEIQNPNLRVPGWFLENKYLDPRRTWVTTVLRALVPWHFWTDVRLSFPIRRCRLVLHVLAIFLIAHLLIAASSAFVTYHEYAILLPYKARGEAIAVALYPYRSGWFMHTTGDVLPMLKGPGWAIVLAQALAPLGYFSLIKTMARVRVRPIHLLRGWAYTLTPLAAAAAILAAWAAVITALPRMVGRLLSLLPFPSMIATVSVVSVGWVIVHWYVFTRTYLRLPHAGWVTLAMLAIAGLLALLLQVALFWVTRDPGIWLL